MRAKQHQGNKMPIGNPFAGIETTREYQHFRRSLVHRFVGKKPTVRERVALDNVARLMTRAHFASADPASSPDMLCKLAAAAEHALQALKHVCAERPRPRRNPTDALMLSANEVRP
jgi:hypothetical protein